MHIADTISDSRAFDAGGRLAYTLRAGASYVLHDAEVAGGLRDGALGSTTALDRMLPRYGGQALGAQSVLALHIGGMGDGLVLLSCLDALQRRYPRCRIDVSCPEIHHPALSLARTPIRVRRYPPTVQELEQYTYYMTLEDVDRHAAPGLSNLEIFGRCLQTPPATESVVLEPPEAARAACELGPADHPRVGVGLTRTAHMRAYPPDLVLRLARALLEQKMAVFLFGVGAEVGVPLPHAPPMLCNMIDRTPDVATLAAMLAQMDAVVCPDTFFMHLAGGLRRPTAAIFSASPCTVAGGYPTVLPVTAELPCSPCGATADHCPAGHPECIVHRRPELHPRRLAYVVERLLHGTILPTAGQAGRSLLE